MKKKKKHFKKKTITSSIILLLIAITTFLSTSTFPESSTHPPDQSGLAKDQQNQTSPSPEQPTFDPGTSSTTDLLKVHYIDVGQGDAIFIELPNRQTMLIDAGEANKGEIVEKYISDLEHQTINYLIGTHPHTDHIGGLEHIIKTFETDTIYMPKAISTSKTYESLLTAILEQNKKIITAKAGVTILQEPNLHIDIIAPNQEIYADLNNYSAVIQITYGTKVFLFMGDAETQSENEISENIKADVIKVGHHGSNTSSSQTFIDKVSPEYAIIMVGENNQYKHPSQDIVDRWTKSGATVYRTDRHGSITITTNGTDLEITTSK